MVAASRALCGLAAWFGVLWVPLAFAGGALAAPFVYVADSGGSDVSQYDASSGALTPLSPPTVASGGNRLRWR